MNFEAGSEFGRYSIISAIGAGGMGEIFLAQDKLLERRVALKVLPEQFTSDAQRLQRFVREAKAASALNHPNIITIYEIGEVEGTSFISTEYVDGQTLRSRISTGSLKLDEVLSVARQTAEALAAAHAVGIVHRDIKPENIMLREDGYVKVLDFGLAKLSEPGTAYGEVSEAALEASTRLVELTEPGTVMGTPSYMSPEQTRGRRDLDGRTDIWSLGVVIFEMLTGTRPFAGDTSSDIIASILKSEPRHISEITPRCPSQLDHIVAKALRKDRDDRYQQIRDLAIDIKSLQKELHSSPSSPAESFAPVPTAESRAALTTDASSPRRYAAPLATAIVIISCVVAASWWYLGAGSNRSQAVDASNLRTIEIASWSSSPGEVYSPGKFSPDGKMIAFESTRGGGKHIWIKQATTAGEAVQITKDEFSNEQPIWSPDGDELAYFSTRGDQPGIWRIPVLGGSPKLVLHLEDRGIEMRRWANDGSIYFITKGEIAGVDVGSSEVRPITDFKALSINAQSIALSPDGKFVAYTIIEDKSWSIWAGELSSLEKCRKILNSASDVRNIVWHADGRRILFSRLIDGTFQIHSVSSDTPAPDDGGSSEQITNAERDCFVQDIAADGSRILFASAKEESDIWKVDVRDGNESVITSEIDAELWPSVSPDGRAIAFQSIKNLSQGNKLHTGAIMVKNIAATDSPSVEVAASGYLPTWSPDGRQFAFAQSVEGKHQLATVGLNGGAANKLTTEGMVIPDNSLLPYNRAQAFDFSWSPDGAMIAYISKRSGHSNIWVVNAADRTQEYRITNNEDAKTVLHCPAWSPDGAYVAFAAKTLEAGRDRAPRFNLMIADLKGRSTREVFGQETSPRIIGWLPGGRDLIVASFPTIRPIAKPGDVSLFSVNILSGEARAIRTLPNAYLYNIHLAPGGRSIAFAANTDGKDNIWLLGLTGIEVKKVTSNNDSRLYFSSLAWSPDAASIYFGKQLRYSLLSMISNFK